MKSIVKRLTIDTKGDVELINITPIVKDVVTSAGVSDGIVYVTTMHTTSGITVNEGLPDVEADLLTMLENIASEFGDYRHQRFLPSEGGISNRKWGYGHGRAANDLFCRIRWPFASQVCGACSGYLRCFIRAIG